jgi:glyoxylase-like metal-dependent hydrolase (beta-lactamase superfamily II)
MPDTPEREITNVTGDLYRFREVRHVGMFLVTPDGIIVVDPTNPGLAQWLKDELDERFGLPVRYVIYSHAHNDHASGGEVFADTATFLANDSGMPMATGESTTTKATATPRWRSISWESTTAVASRAPTSGSHVSVTGFSGLSFHRTSITPIR